MAIIKAVNISGTQYDIAANVAVDTSTEKAYVTTTPDGTNLKYHSSVYVNHSTGRLMGAAWNDYAEFRKTEEEIQAGRVVCENGDDTLSLATERLQPGANIVTDTYGFAIGETKICGTPIAVSGRVLAYTFENRTEYKAGDCVCSGPNGTVSKMTREEIKEYPDRIIGTVSSIPNYDTWGENNIKVNERIWIKVK